MKAKQAKDAVNKMVLVPILAQLVRVMQAFLERIVQVGRIDELGVLKAVAAPINKRIDSIQKELWEKNGAGARLTGEIFEVLLVEQPFTFYDKDKIETLLSERTQNRLRSEGVRHRCEVKAISGKGD